jgi:restriction endonuclease
MSSMSEPVKNALFSYPPQAAFGRPLPKNKLYEKAGANTRLKDLFVAQVDQIVWKYKLAPETIIGDVNEAALRRIQIREAIKAHFEKEQELHKDGIKVLTLFFIDEVAKYRDYSQIDEKGEYARVFEEESVFNNKTHGFRRGLNEPTKVQETKGIAIRTPDRP